ncbi:diguanylate cyclase domain-containing protein [Paludibaculum fermentans]|uniref:Diguanylate cyclase n=1 Tax=Paludibaculum fermentans TaxID=1473598 RepID=A0A7S7SNH9_PALFE|nr:diguanylate cyclase [Paludibaculum fermentans]QOY90938.1 diguanylate cyclase [Paludibaculum fermentans]
MPLITLKRYLSNSDDEIGLHKIVSMLLHGMADHAVCADPQEHDSFRQDMQSIEEAANQDCSHDQLLVIAGAAIHALDCYAVRTTRAIRRQDSELQNMIDMLAQTVIAISGGNERAAPALNEIRTDLEQAASFETVQSLKSRLGACLVKVRDEATRQKQENDAAINELRGHLLRAQAPVAQLKSSSLDPVTNLPDQAAAMTAFQEGLKTAGRKYVLTLVVGRMQPINARFGQAVGDEMLRLLKKHVQAQVMQEGEQIFRWTGPTLVALLPRQETIDQIRSKLKRALDVPLQNEVDIGGRSVLLPLSIAWSVIALIPPITNTSMFISKFIASQTPLDYC